MAIQETDEKQEAKTAEIEKRLDELEKAHADEVEDLHFEIQTLEKELADLQAKSRAGAPQSASVFNPGITVFGNFFARDDDQAAYVDDDPTLDRIDDRMNLREVELDFRAAIDPWADGVVIGTFESEVPNEFDAEIEEGYVVLKKLPILDEAPGGLKLKVGRFRPEFGRFNYVHLHDLPQPTYPRALTEFLGGDGFIQDGVSGQFFIPTSSEHNTLDATFQVLDGGGLPLAEQEEESNIATLGHLKWFRDISDTTNMELGVSGYENDADHQLFGVDGTYKWKPLSGGEWHSFLIGGELFATRLDDPSLGDDPMGFYLWSQYQFQQNLYFGVRYDRAEELTDADQVSNTFGAFLTYYTTEFLRFRIGLEHTESDVDSLDGLNTASLELNFVFGSHPVEPYWVNR
jgi:hypothetical protein